MIGLTTTLRTACRVVVPTALAVVAMLAMAASPGSAAAQSITPGPDAVIYEVTEDMALIGADGNPTSDVRLAVARVAVAQLSGWAALGTPLCPYEVLITNPKTKTCTLNVVGSDSIDLATGIGTVEGRLRVVVQGDNPTDAPEFVVMTGSFTGTMDLSLALSGAAPLGYIRDGLVRVDGVAAAIPFDGTFRLPFAVRGKSRVMKPRPGEDAHYLGDLGQLVRVRPEERSLGIPTVRFEVTFPRR